MNVRDVVSLWSPERVEPLVQLELLNMGKTGELKQLWDVAAVTNLRINLVGSHTSAGLMI